MITLCAGCHKEQISVYTIPKEPPAGLPNAQEANGANGPLPFDFKIPGGWQQQAPTGMSIASFSIADRKAELSVMSFPGEGASRLNVVNIVRQENGLPPLSDEELSKIVVPIEVGGEKGSLIDLTRGTTSPTNNNNTDSITIAVVPHGGATWFFKLAGVSEVVAAQKPAMLDFLKSVSFKAEANEPMSPHGQSFASANTGRVPSEQPPFAGSSPDAVSGKPAWQVPPGWSEVPPSQMLLAKFVISGKDGEADVTVSTFAGPAGGTLPNVNRWRGQVGLEPISQEELDKDVSSLDVPDGKAMLVDVNGKSPKTGKEIRLVGVIWPRDGQTWFYKLMGDSAVAARQKDAFLKFIQSVRYSDG
ncbi:MAG TPA: hypothetical protein VFB72_00155 [Verrucomicrobiae bacterium]|nr:hypothetical protein [Verrucomicrobiae bacterium]